MNRQGITAISGLLASSFLLLGPCGCAGPGPEVLEVSWDGVPDRPWPGPELWANRVQDWEVRGERLEAVLSRPMRTAHFLALQTDPGRGSIAIDLEMGLGAPEAN